MGSFKQVPVSKSIATRLLKTVFGIYLVIATAVTIGQMVLEYKYQKSSIKEGLKDIQATFQHSLALNIWEMNQASIHSTIGGIIKIPTILGIKIQDRNERPIAMGGVIEVGHHVIDSGLQVNLLGLDHKNLIKNSKPKNSLTLFQHQFPIIYTTPERSRSLGFATLYSGTSVVYHRVKLGFIMLIGNAILKIILLWFIFLFFTNKLIKKPLNTLTNATSNLSLTNLKSFKVDTQTQDQNEIKALESTINRMVSNLDDAVTHREELENKLRQSEKLQAIGQLAGGIAHDFNNQLGGIVGYAEILKDELGDQKELVFYVEKIMKTVKRAADITAQLLAFARKGKYVSISANIHRIIMEVVSLLEHTIDRKIYILQELKANPAYTRGDPSQLQNALLNIAINARDAMPKGGTLQFKTDTCSMDEEQCRALSTPLEPGDYLYIAIMDSGVGMSPETREKIFDPFFTTKELGQGTGMGLAAVYGTISNHKGAVEVKSELGKGTTFEIYLPLDKSERKPTESPDTEKSKFQQHSAHILVVDDEAMIGEVTSEMLIKMGHTVSVCTNGQEAVDTYRKQWRSIDLVILDVIMPEKDGEEAFREMKEINPEVKVIVVSGYAKDGKAQTILNEGGKDFLGKPFMQSDLALKIDSVLSD